MNIWFDIYTANNENGVATDYCVHAHYELNEHDYIDHASMKQLKNEVEELIRDRLNKAASNNRTHNRIDDKIGLDLVNETIDKDPFKKEVTVIRTYREV